VSLRDLPLRKRFLRPYVWSGAGSLVVVLPLTFMNRSGDVVPGLLRSLHADVDDLVVVCDNMDLRPGVVRIKRRGESRAHNGLASIMDTVGTGDFTRLYVGVGRPTAPVSVVEHVLSAPPRDEAPFYASAIESAARALVDIHDRGVDEVMNEVNRRQ
jgi:peptidyl-tRNA hydrolase, PTH1 family